MASPRAADGATPPPRPQSTPRPQRLYMTIPLVPPGPQGQTTGRLRFDPTPLPAWGQTPPPPDRSAPFAAPPDLSALRREMARIEAALAADRAAQEHPSPFIPTQAIIIDDTPAARRSAPGAVPAAPPLRPGESDRFLYDWATCTSWPILYAPIPAPDGAPASAHPQQALRIFAQRSPDGCGGMPGAFQGGIPVYAPGPPDGARHQRARDARPASVSSSLADPDPAAAPLRPPPSPPPQPVDDDPSPFTYITGPPVRLMLPPRMNAAAMWTNAQRAPAAQAARRRRRRAAEAAAAAKQLSPAQLHVLAAAHVERADAELRARMAALGMGKIGGSADGCSDGGGGGDDDDGLLGCAVCLEPYQRWNASASRDDAVAVGCAGFHTLHRRCLAQWLEVSQPHTWSCPFCRDRLAPPAALLATLTAQAAAGNTGADAAAGRGRDDAADAQAQGQAQAQAHANAQMQRDAEEDEAGNDEAVYAGMSMRNSLRAEVHRREREQRWRCDAPACLPDYDPKLERASRPPTWRVQRRTYQPRTNSCYHQHEHEHQHEHQHYTHHAPQCRAIPGWRSHDGPSSTPGKDVPRAPAWKRSKGEGEGEGEFEASSQAASRSAAYAPCAHAMASAESGVHTSANGDGDAGPQARRLAPPPSLDPFPPESHPGTTKDGAGADAGVGWCDDVPEVRWFTSKTFPAEQGRAAFVSLTPCRHEFHSDCLRTALGVQEPLTLAAIDRDLARLARKVPLVIGEPDGAVSTGDADATEWDWEDDELPTGHWVTCPACRHEAWIKLA